MNSEKTKTAHKIKSSKNSGIALISVLFIGLMILILVVTFSFAAISENRAAGNNKTVIKLTELAEATSEQARVKLGKTFEDEQYTEKGFVDALRDQLSGGASVPGLSGNHSRTVAGTSSRWEVRAVSPEGNDVAWVDIAATAENPKGSQTVIQRIGFSPSDIFELAMLTETVNCMFCHLQVEGDVGTLAPFQPGWSAVFGGNGDANAGESSKVNGNLYAADAISQINQYTDLDGDPATVNGAVFTGTVEEYSTSRKLPKDVDGDGKADFPPINREKAKNSARGSLSGGELIKVVGLNNDLNNLNGGVGSLGKYTNGNVIIVGTNANPINLDEDIYVEGDVIIKGVVTGQGAIYTGRNIYIAGNVTVKNPPDATGTGVCVGINDPDACAKLNITAGKDTLRFGARGSIIIGDYTEFENVSNDYGEWSNGNEKRSNQMPWSRRQNAEYFRSQFGFGWQDVKAYDTRNGDELEWREDLQGYVNVDGDIVDGGSVVEVDAEDGHKTEVDGDDAYDYSFRPGRVKSNGGFDSWVSDEMYREILGTEDYTYNSWRHWVTWTNDKDSWKVDEEEFKANFRLSMEGNNMSISDDSLDEIWDRRAENPDWPIWENSHIPIVGENGEDYGVVYWSGAHGGDGAMLRVLITAEASYETQVTNIDAFLYANQRIAGKTSMKALAINGGMIAKNIGVLAPGRTPDNWPWYQNEVLGTPEGTTGACQNPDDEYYVEGSKDCALSLNYDHRLRNGGFGFNLVATETGKTLSWRQADNSSEKVQ